MRSNVIRNLIHDIGTSEGDDTDFYLAKGFRVVGIEADPDACTALKTRFADAITDGRLTVINRAAFSESGQTIEFFADREAQGHSKLIGPGGRPNRKGNVVSIPTIGWEEAVSIAGLPYYCKIDIEGAEAPFLASMRGKDVPEFISVECHDFSPIEGLYLAGYRRFRILHQNAHNAFGAPNPPREGNYVPNYKFKHSSGFFGEELPQQVWVGFREIVAVFDALERLKRHGAAFHLWFDCHARFG